MWVTVTCSSLPVNMSEKIGGMVWFSSGIIFDSCPYGGLWLGQVQCLPFSLILPHLESVNHHQQVLKLEPLELWHHRLIGFGCGVCGVSTCTRYELVQS